MSEWNIEGRLPNTPLELLEVLRELQVIVNDQARRVRRGEGSPNGVIVGYKGDIWQRTDGGTATCQYVFEGTDGALTGWVAK